MRTGIRIAVGLIVVLVVVVLLLGARGSRERVDLTSGDPQLRRICLSDEPRSDRILLDRCFRIRGTLLHVWRERGESGRLADFHLLVAARLHLYVVKVYPPFPAEARVGRQVIVVGPLVRPQPEHLGIHEVEGFHLGGPAVGR